MKKDRRLLIFVLFIVLMPSCRFITGTSTLKPSQITQKATFTSEQITTNNEHLIETPTTGPTETLRPSNTLRPTDTIHPPLFTPEPFLPSGLAQIGVENIGGLGLISGIPVMEIYNLAFSQSGKKIATLSEYWEDRSDYLEVWDLLSGDQILSQENLDAPWNPFFSPDENLLFVTYNNQGIYIYDLIQQKVVRRVDISADWSDFSPDGKSIAVGDYLGTPEESTIRLIDLETEEERFTSTLPGMVMDINYSPDGSLLTSGFQSSNHFRELVWDISTQEIVADLMDYDYLLTFSADNSLAALAKGGEIYILSTDDWVLISSYGSEDPYRTMKPRDFSLNGDILAVEDRYNIVFLETNTGEELFTLPNECDVRFSPQGTTLLTWCYQGELKIWGVIP